MGKFPGLFKQKRPTGRVGRFLFHTAGRLVAALTLTVAVVLEALRLRLASCGNLLVRTLRIISRRRPVARATRVFVAMIAIIVVAIAVPIPGPIIVADRLVDLALSLSRERGLVAPYDS